MKLTDACIKKPLFAWMIMAGTVVFGFVAASRIGISQYPDVDFPVISIAATWEGAAPEAMEQDVVEQIEEAVMQVEGVRSLASSSRQGAATISVELDLSRDVDVALQEVQAKVANVQRRLPRDMDPPTISKSNPEDQPIMWVGLTGPFSRQLLADTARYRVKEKLQTVPGVGEVTVGTLDRNLRVWVDAEKLEARALTIEDIIAALGREHVELPAGLIQADNREINVRVLGEALDTEAFGNLVIRQNAGATVYLRDVALIEDGFEDVRRITRIDGVPAQGMGIRKQRGANAVAVGNAVNKVLKEIRTTLPDGMRLVVNFDSTQYIRESIHEIEWELMLSVLLTALVCWLFLGSFSNTLNVALAIPMSLCGTMAVIYFLGFTLNTFTLLALSLAVGIVVDDAIMVLENIFRHAETGKDRVRAAREGTEEITFAALAATLAIVAIFVPVVFMEGVIGRFFLQFGITFSVAVLLSYLEAVTLAPARASQLIDTSREQRSRVGRVVDQAFAALAGRYRTILRWALGRPRTVLSVAALTFVAALAILLNLPSEFVPSQDQSRLSLRVQTAVGSSIEETDRAFRQVEAIVRSRPEVLRLMANVGGQGASGVSAGSIMVTLVPPSERLLSQAELSQELRKELRSLPGVRVVIQDLSQAGFTAQRGFPVEFSIRGPDWDELVRLSSGIMTKLRDTGVVVDLDTDYLVGMPELRITPDRARAADLGVPIERIASTLNALVGGVRVGKYSTGGRRVDVRVRLLAAQRQRPEDLVRLKVRTEAGEFIPLSAVTRQEERPVLQSITRRDRERAITVYANIAPGHAQDEALAYVESLSRDLPASYHAVLGGASVAFRDSTRGLLFALFLGILVAYMVLTSQFNSLLHPVTVLTILPLSVAGAAVALWLTGQTLNTFSMIGLLLLMGIVKKNSILLVDYANLLRERGADALTAMQEAGPVRLRPILMTSVSTLMAAIPASLGLGPGSEVRAPMAIGVIGGLIISTAMSLLVVPSFYVVANQQQQQARAWFARRKAPQTTAPGSQA